MKPKILSWNIRELNDPNKHVRIKSLLCSWKVNIVCLQETKLHFIDKCIIHSLWECSFLGWAYLVSMGVSGGVILMWNTRVVESVEECIENFYIACSFKNVEDG